MRQVAKSALLAVLLSGCWSLTVTTMLGQTKPEQAKSSTPPLQIRARKEQVIARLEQIIPPLMKDGDVPGLAVALVRNGELVWQRGFGMKNAQTKEPVTDTTVFEAASLSKPVFAYAVLKLADAGKFDLDKPLQQYLPGNYDVGDDARLGQMTARHVLSHTTGFPNWRPRGAALKIHFTPGARFSYSGEGFVYLAKVIEQVTGEKFNDFMKRTVFDPLGMTSSNYVWRNDYETLKTFLHNSRSEPTGQNRITQANAAASLQTTAQDFGRFVAAVLQGTGLKKETQRQMLTPQVKVSTAGTNTVSRAPEQLSPAVAWGLGWGLQTTSDGVSFWHWGDNGNSKAYVVANAKQKLGAVIFANSATGLSIVREILDVAVGGAQPAFDWLKYESYRSPARTLYKKILAQGAQAAISEYRQWRKGRAADEAINEDQLNRLGYDLLGAQRVKDAIEVFRLNVEEHPQSANTYDSLGEAYAAAGDKEQAIKNYQRSVELNPGNTNGVEALKKLQGNQ